MAFSSEYTAPQRWWDFDFYESGGADGVYSGSVAPGTLYRFGEVRLHFSVAFASVEDLVIYVSSIKGSAYNHKFVSEALNGLTDLRVFFSNPIFLQSDDQLVVAMSMKSAVNIWGLEILGWAVRG